MLQQSQKIMIVSLQVFLLYNEILILQSTKQLEIVINVPVVLVKVVKPPLNLKFNSVCYNLKTKIHRHIIIQLLISQSNRFKLPHLTSLSSKAYIGLTIA